MAQVVSIHGTSLSLDVAPVVQVVWSKIVLWPIDELHHLQKQKTLIQAMHDDNGTRVWYVPKPTFRTLKIE